jgi:phosphoribosylformylglycinamidine synthase
MTEQRYETPVTSFELQVDQRPWVTVDVMGEGRTALKKISDKMGLSFDDWDLDYYTNLFRNVLKRNPTSVECFDLAQSNSEHSRHWFFKGLIELDGQEFPHSLIDLVASTQQHSAPNNVIKFNDNSSAIRGFNNLQVLRPADPTRASEMQLKKDAYRHILFTAETHNFPTGVAPFQGATTGNAFSASYSLCTKTQIKCVTNVLGHSKTNRSRRSHS